MPRRRPQARLVVALAVAIWCSIAAQASAVPVTNVAGADRYLTAVELSRASHSTTAPAVVIAGGAAWPDALGGSALAGVTDGPVLLTEQHRLTGAVGVELVRLAPARVFLLGGTASLASRVESQVASLLPAAEVVRIGGADRAEVANRVAARVAAERGSAPERVFVVTGRSFADALACAAPAAARGWPILLAEPTRPAEIAETVSNSGASRAIIVGGTASVPATVERAIELELGAANVDRLSSGDRYGVSVAVSRWAAGNAGLSMSNPVVASGVVHADALAAGPFSAKRGSSMLLARSTGLPDVVAEEFFAKRDVVERFTFVGGTATLPTWVRAEAQYALRARPFSAGNAMAHVKALTGFGVRTAGSLAENKAAAYVATELRSYGYAVSTQTFGIPGGKRSTNVIAELPGTAPGVIVLGAHLDSKWPSPGGNDNASGVGVTLELARCLADAEGLAPTVRFIAFGAEEISGRTAADHHFGSRHYVDSRSSTQLAAIQGMVSIDMVGYGDVFNIRNLAVAPMTVVGSLRSWGTTFAEPLVYLKDPSRTGWSDHEAFEFEGVPVAWLEWRDDPKYHTSGDNYAHVSSDRVRRTGRVVRGWLLDTTTAELNAFR